MDARVTRRPHGRVRWANCLPITDHYSVIYVSSPPPRAKGPTAPFQMYYASCSEASWD